LKYTIFLSIGKKLPEVNISLVAFNSSYLFSLEMLHREAKNVKSMYQEVILVHLTV